MKMEYALQWKIIVLSILMLLWSFATGLHLGNVDQKKNVKQLTKQANDIKAQNGIKKADGKMSATKNVSDMSQNQQSMAKLQLEIQELLRMQKQLKSEMVPGANNPKKTKLLQHIKTQIQLRRMQQKQGKKHNHQDISKPSNDVATTHNKVNLHHQKSPAAKKVNITPKAKTQTDFQTQSKLSNQQMQMVQNVQTNQYLEQQDQIQQLKQQKQEIEQRSKYTLQSKRKHISPVKSRLPPMYANEPAQLKSDQNLQMQYANADMMFSNLNAQSQQQPQMQALSPSAFVQQRVPVQLDNQVVMNQAQIKLVDQQVPVMKQSGVQLGSPQHVLVPINALPVNSFVPGNVLQGDRYIFLDTALQDNVQFAMADGSVVIKAEKKKTKEKTTTPEPVTTKASTQAQQITKPTTQRPSTTVATTPPTTYAPTPPTTERITYEPVPVNNALFKQQFYNGELQRQQLEITKLKLEIRALRRKELADMRGGGGGESENEDAPPRRRNMMRFRHRGMPFQFFK